MKSYQNIRHMTRPVPSRPRMPRQNRAKIFAPYQALKGFCETVHAKDTVYVCRLELSEYAQERIDRELRQLRRWDTVTVTWFQPRQDENDRGSGQYITVTGTIEHIDPVFRVLLLVGQKIPIGDITDLRGERLDGTSEWDITGEISVPEETVR